MRRWVISIGCLAHACIAPVASAEESVRLTIHGEVSIRSEKGGASHTCNGECTFTVPQGTYIFVAPDVEETLRIDGPTTVTHKKGQPTLRTAGGILAASGVVLAGLGVYIALEVCKTTYRPETNTTDRPCKDGPTATRDQNIQYALLGGAGIAFTAAVVGGFLYFGAGPSLSFDTPVKDSSGVPVAGIAPIPGGAAFVLAGTF
ncbi:MAG: hypothetical protein ACXWUG_21895 [Polyangiales bacterium]